MAGGAGFLGSHLCERLVARGDDVVCLDDLSTGSAGNLAPLGDCAAFSFVRCDVSRHVPVEGAVDVVFHLASPASPPAYLAHPLETLAAGSEGTRRLAELAGASGARFVLASTSEVYGDPDVHPQPERYRGNVDPVGPRSVYDEAKRFAEALTMAAHRARGVDVGIARIFNTYGPRLSSGDGRVVSNFCVQALTGQPLTVYGDGSQTRSLCFVSDLVSGLLALAGATGLTGPVNLGNPDERTVGELARLVVKLAGSSSPVEHRPLPTDDPRRRCPDITLARGSLGWQPAVTLEDGLELTLAWFRRHIGGAGG